MEEERQDGQNLTREQEQTDEQAPVKKEKGFTLWWLGLIIGVGLGILDGKPFFNSLWWGIILTGALGAVVGWGVRIVPKKKAKEK